MSLKKFIFFVIVASLCIVSKGCQVVTKYDGTYDWVITNVNGQTRSCQSCIFITNGQISNSDETFSGSVSDNLTFNGSCPNGNSATGIFKGTLEGSNPYMWQGTWTCSDGSNGGSNSIWKIYNKH
jgi:hypothetical protein